MPDLDAIVRALDATWPAASVARVGPWTIREGQGGGGRVSAATCDGPPDPRDIALAEDAMVRLGQVPLFMLRPQDGVLDAILAAAGYLRIDPVTIHAADAARLAGPVPPVMAFQTYPPLAVQREIWADGGIGPARIAIMDRSATPKATFLGRIDDRPAGSVFVAASGGIAMLHALHVVPAHRRNGLGRHLVRAVANWCGRENCATLTLAVHRENRAAGALYADMGFAPVGGYHYRSRDGTK